MDRAKLDRISELTRISRTRALSEEETAEREALRQEYRAAIRAGLEAELERTYLRFPDGTVKKVKKNNQ